MKVKHLKVKNLKTGAITAMTQTVLDNLNKNNALKIPSEDDPNVLVSRFEIVEPIDKHGLNVPQAKAFDKKYIHVKKPVLPAVKRETK